jgi:hypothetical protein
MGYASLGAVGAPINLALPKYGPGDLGIVLRWRKDPIDGQWWPEPLDRNANAYELAAKPWGSYTSLAVPLFLPWQKTDRRYVYGYVHSPKGWGASVFDVEPWWQANRPTYAELIAAHQGSLNAGVVPAPIYGGVLGYKRKVSAPPRSPVESPATPTFAPDVGSRGAKVATPSRKITRPMARMMRRTR